MSEPGWWKLDEYAWGMRYDSSVAHLVERNTSGHPMTLCGHSILPTDEFHAEDVLMPWRPKGVRACISCCLRAGVRGGKRSRYSIRKG